jgi:adenylylsulfate kinase
LPCVLWFTGLSGSGKSTIAEQVIQELQRMHYDVEHLDGDTVRNVFPLTGFTKQDRDEHVKRMGFMASLLEKHGVSVVASFVSPYRESRDFVRRQCKRFIEVHISTPFAECERRDVKGLYARARRGEIQHFTGLDDPYEAPLAAEITLNTSHMSVQAAARTVLDSMGVTEWNTH